MKAIYHFFRRLIGLRLSNLFYDFPSFAPASDASIHTLNKLTRNELKSFPNILFNISAINSRVKFLDLSHFNNDNDLEFEKAFNVHGSDKGTHHGYFKVYNQISRDYPKIKLFEVGLGTNNKNIVSNMGRNGKPGASLRAFASLHPNGLFFGGDIDDKILFSEDRISTFYFDQCNSKLMNSVLTDLNTKFDVIIDDGLHSPSANILMFLSCLDFLSKGGTYVIEDVRSESLGLLLAGILASGRLLDVSVVKCNHLNLIYVREVLQ
jgi:hypothetical protein